MLSSGNLSVSFLRTDSEPLSFSSFEMPVSIALNTTGSLAGLLSLAASFSMYAEVISQRSCVHCSSSLLASFTHVGTRWMCKFRKKAVK